jgi:hypothetical protein
MINLFYWICRRKHGVDSLLRLGVVRLVDAACVHPEEFQAVKMCLISAKLNFGVTGFALASTSLQLCEDDLFATYVCESIAYGGMSSFRRSSVRRILPASSRSRSRIVYRVLIVRWREGERVRGRGANVRGICGHNN